MTRREDSESLSRKYKERNYHLSDQEIAVYSKVRLPATKAALQVVLTELEKRVGTSLSDLSFMDLGAGPATLFLALQSLERTPKEVLLLEKNERLIEEGIKNFPESLSHYQRNDFTKISGFTKTDVALSSYSLNEIPKELVPDLVNKLFDSVSYWVVVEPGTPDGYHNVLTARDLWIKRGGFVLAPCPHNKPCPLPAGDWCHFAVRVQRDKEHRLLKGGALPYEDEKFSYMILSKDQKKSCNARIIRRPVERKGLVEMVLCTNLGIKKEIYTKSNNENFKIIKKKEWGDEIV